MFSDRTVLPPMKYMLDIYVLSTVIGYYSLILRNIANLPAGVEARGFMFGPSIALAIGAKFVPLRKPRKLPGTSTRKKWSPFVYDLI